MRLNLTAFQTSHSLTVMLTLYLDGRYADVLPASSFPIIKIIFALYLSKTCYRQVIVFVLLQEPPTTIISIEVPIFVFAISLSLAV